MNPRLTLAQVWLALAVLVPVLGSMLASLSTVDLAYHVRAGTDAISSGSIPTTDTFTFTVAGEPWLNQQWLAQIALALVHRLGGWELLAVLRAVLIGLTFGLVLRACLVRGAPPRTASLLTLGAFAIALPTLALRPQLFGVVLFALLLLIVADRRRHPSALWLAPVIVVLWANVHGSFVLAPVLLGYAWLEDRLDGVPSRQALAVLVVSTVVTLLNPFGPGVWGYAIGLGTNREVTDRIVEWQPTSLRTLTGALFFGSALLVAGFLARRGRVAPWPVLLWLGFLFLLGAWAVRGVAWWPLGAVVAVAGLIGPAAVERVRRDPPRAVNVVVVGVVLVLVVVFLPWFRAPDPVTGRDGLLTHAPSAATAELALLAADGDRLFAPQDLGSWFEWAVPVAPVFVDSRIELFPPEVWADRDAIVAGKAGWEAILDRREVSIVAVDLAREGAFAGRMRSAAGWREAWADDEVAIFVRG